MVNCEGWGGQAAHERAARAGRGGGEMGRHELGRAERACVYEGTWPSTWYSGWKALHRQQVAARPPEAAQFWLRVRDNSPFAGCSGEPRAPPAAPQRLQSPPEQPKRSPPQRSSPRDSHTPPRAHPPPILTHSHLFSMRPCQHHASTQPSTPRPHFAIHNPPQPSARAARPKCPLRRACGPAARCGMAR